MSASFGFIEHADLTIENISSEARCAPTHGMHILRQVKMKWQPIPEETECLTQIVVKMEATLGELYHYCRFGRHRKDLPQKAYLLFSRCGLLLSSLVLAERQAHSGTVENSPTLATLLGTLPPETLCNHGDSSRVLNTNDYETDLTNDPKWFKLWANVLEHLAPTTASDIGHFSGYVLKHLAVSDLSHEQPVKKQQQKALTDLLGSPQAGRLFLHSIRILETIVSGLAGLLAQLDPAIHANEQMQALACLMSQVRRTVVYQSVAVGQYLMPDRIGWEPSRARLRVARGKALGLLTVAATDESEEITCTYTWEPETRKRERSWSRAIAALPCDYEEMLFKTWCYETGDYHRIVDLFGQSGARWIVGSEEAEQLETICEHVDKLLHRLDTHQECHTASEHLFRVARNNQRRWTPTELPWTFVRNLDKAIDKLRFACREATALGGDNPVAQVLSQLWPPESLEPHAGMIGVAEGYPLESEMSPEETPVDSETPSRATISTGPLASPSQELVPDGRRADADRDTENHSAATTAREDSAPQVTSSPMESSESVTGQPPGDGTVADHGGAIDDPGQGTSSSTPPSQQKISPQDQNKSPSSQTNERPKLPRGRVEKLAATMNILLGESVDGKEKGSQSSP
jgi:hypothetical protein